MRVLLVVLAVWAVGCGTTSYNLPDHDFLAADAALFDDAVDSMEAPVIVKGAPGTFDRRVERADLVAVVRVESLSSDLVRRQSAYRLAVRIDERLKGAFEGDLLLRVEDDQPGYETVRAHEDRLLRDPFLAFVKWESDPGSEEPPIAHWHLSPASAASVDRARQLLDRSASDADTEAEVLSP